MQVDSQMQIGSMSEEMQWILLKFLRDSLEFLSDDASKAMRTSRQAWAIEWQKENLPDKEIKKWMPVKDVV